MSTTDHVTAAVREAVRRFWTARQDAGARQALRGDTDRGGRGQVTAGKNMDGFVRLIRDVADRAGLPADSVLVERRAVTLPGFFRPSKSWDVTVVHRGALLAAIEFKSQAGTSMGNNFNNRSEEAVGSAYDLRCAYDEGLLGQIDRPFIGWFMFVEENSASTRPHRDGTQYLFEIDQIMRRGSYIDRYVELCQRLTATGLYTSCALVSAPASSITSGDFTVHSDDTSPQQFLDALEGHLTRAVRGEPGQR